MPIRRIQRKKNAFNAALWHHKYKSSSPYVAPWKKFFFQKFVICSVAQLHSYFCCIHDFVVFIFLWISYFSVNKRSTTKIDKAPRLKQRYAPCMISVASERGIATRACSGSCVHKMHFPIEIVFEQFGLHAKRNRAKIIEYK